MQNPVTRLQASAEHGSPSSQANWSMQKSHCPVEQLLPARHTAGGGIVAHSACVTSRQVGNGPPKMQHSPTGSPAQEFEWATTTMAAMHRGAVERFMLLPPRGKSDTGRLTDCQGGGKRNPGLFGLCRESLLGTTTVGLPCRERAGEGTNDIVGRDSHAGRARGDSRTSGERPHPGPLPGERGTARRSGSRLGGSSPPPSRVCGHPSPLPDGRGTDRSGPRPPGYSP